MDGETDLHTVRNRALWWHASGTQPHPLATEGCPRSRPRLYVQYRVGAVPRGLVQVSLLYLGEGADDEDAGHGRADDGRVGHQQQGCPCRRGR